MRTGTTESEDFDLISGIRLRHLAGLIGETGVLRGEERIEIDTDDLIRRFCLRIEIGVERGHYLFAHRPVLVLERAVHLPVIVVFLYKLHVPIVETLDEVM